jgi:hypothetical protein
VVPPHARAAELPPQECSQSLSHRLFRHDAPSDWPEKLSALMGCVSIRCVSSALCLFRIYPRFAEQRRKALGPLPFLFGALVFLFGPLLARGYQHSLLIRPP